MIETSVRRHFRNFGYHVFTVIEVLLIKYLLQIIPM